jgi:hypothetical protein
MRERGHCLDAGACHAEHGFPLLGSDLPIVKCHEALGLRLVLCMPSLGGSGIRRPDDH